MGSAPGHAAGAGQTGTGHRAGPGVATNPATVTVNVAKLDAVKVFGLVSTANRDVSNVGFPTSTVTCPHGDGGGGAPTGEPRNLTL